MENDNSLVYYLLLEVHLSRKIHVPLTKGRACPDRGLVSAYARMRAQKRQRNDAPDDIRAIQPIRPDEVHHNLDLTHRRLDLLISQNVKLNERDAVIYAKRLLQRAALGLVAHSEGERERGTLRMVGEGANDETASVAC